MSITNKWANQRLRLLQPIVTPTSRKVKKNHCSRRLRVNVNISREEPQVDFNSCTVLFKNFSNPNFTPDVACSILALLPKNCHVCRIVATSMTCEFTINSFELNSLGTKIKVSEIYFWFLLCWQDCPCWKCCCVERRQWRWRHTQEMCLLRPSKHTCMMFSVGVEKEKKTFFFFSLRPASHLQGKSMCRFFCYKELYTQLKKKKNAVLLSKRA